MKSPVSLDEIVGIMAQADVGIIPKRNDNFGGSAFSTKTLEFMSLGVPIIISHTRIDHYYFNESDVRFFEPENVEDLSVAMLAMIENPSLKAKQIAAANNFVNQFNWRKKQNLYLDIADQLIAGAKLAVKH